MAHKIEQWAANDGQSFNTELEAKRHDFGLPCFDCPNCKCKGTIDGDPIIENRYDEALTGYSGSMYPMYSKQQVGYKQDTCKVCNGSGFTRKEMTPIVKQVITGYK